MTDVALRLLFGVFALVVAIAAGALARRRRRVQQPIADITSFDFEVAVLVFTSTDCANCKKVMNLLSRSGVSVREITYELEPSLFDRAGVSAVPLVVVAGRAEKPNWQHGGKLRYRTLRRALSRAGW